MNASIGVGAAMAAPANGFLRAGHMRPRPFPASALGCRVPDGSYPFRSHRTVADIWATEHAETERQRAPRLVRQSEQQMREREERRQREAY